MNTIFIVFGCIAALFPVANPKLTLKISNIEKVQGEIRVGVFNTGTNFLKQGAAIKNYAIKVDNDTAYLTITDLPKGEYAITMYHDENSDNIMNTNFIGIPKEPYGFSNNVKPKMSAPKYEDCKFSFSADQTLHIKLIN
jgi:uncharacterized protein (DUF2141 family)